MYDEPSPDSILENMPCGYLSFTDDRLIVRANLTLRNMLGQDSSDLSGKSVETVLTLGSRIFFQTHIFPLLKISGHADEIYLSLQGKTGAELPVLANATRTPRSFGFVNEFVIMAMTRRSQYEDQILFAKRRIEDLNRVKEAAMAELEAVNLTLEQQQHVLQSQFSELSSHRDKLEYQALQRAADLTLAIEDLEGFTYAVAHNFRAPLRAIVSASRILLDETPEQLGVVQRSLLERQEYNSLKLSALIDDLLQFARLRRKTLTRTELNVTTLASEVVAELAGQKTNFIIQSDLVCRADSALLRIVLEGLIGNAVKFSPAGGSIRVGMDNIDGASVFFVQDQGIGFAMNYAAKIFHPFERLHLDSEFDGNGIGLATVKRIVELHGGAIWVTSAIGVGSTFYFTLSSADSALHGPANK